MHQAHQARTNQAGARSEPAQHIFVRHAGPREPRKSGGGKLERRIFHSNVRTVGSLALQNAWKQTVQHS
jgi:hypothetical protein